MEGSAGIRKMNCRSKGASPGFKVAILGAAGGIGQPLSMLMKMNPLVSVLHLYDVVNSPGVTADISHMDTAAVVSYTPNFLFFFLGHFCSVILYTAVVLKYWSVDLMRFEIDELSSFE